MPKAWQGRTAQSTPGKRRASRQGSVRTDWQVPRVTWQGSELRDPADTKKRDRKPEPS